MSSERRKDVSQASAFVRFIYARIFPIPFILGGVLALYLSFPAIDLGFQSRSWPSVGGRITASSVEWRSGAKRSAYWGVVSYAYAVDGRPYSSKQVSFGEYGASDRSHAQEVIDRYPEGSMVRVFFRPAEPSQAVLEPGLSISTFAMPGLGLVFVSAGIAMLVYIPKTVSRTARKVQTAEVETGDEKGSNADDAEDSAMQRPRHELKDPHQHGDWARGQFNQFLIGLGCVAVILGFKFSPAITLGAISAMLIVTAFVLFFRDAHLSRSGRRTGGTVVGFQTVEDGYFPIVEFKDENGTPRREATWSGSGARKPPKGTQVTVFYDPSGKIGCEIDRFWSRNIVAASVALLGVFFALATYLATHHR